MHLVRPLPEWHHLKKGFKSGRSDEKMAQLCQFDFWHVTKNSKLEENEPLLWNYVYIWRAKKTQNQKFHMSKNPQRTNCAAEAFQIKDSSRECCGRFLPSFEPVSDTADSKVPSMLDTVAWNESDKCTAFVRLIPSNRLFHTQKHAGHVLSSLIS